MKKTLLFSFILMVWGCNTESIFAQTPVDQTSARRLLAEATILCDSGKFEQAGKCAHLALDFFRKLPVSAEWAEAAYLTGRAFLKLDSLPLARTMLEESVQQWNSMYPDGSVQEAKAHLELGNTWYKLNDPTKAIAEGKSVIKMQHILPENHSVTVFSLQLVGRTYSGIGQYRDAIPYLEDAAKMARICFGQTSAELSKILYRLGVTYSYSGFYELAVTSLEQALAIQQKNLSPSNPAIADSHLALGYCLLALKKFESAQSYFKQALETAKLSGKDTSTAMAYYYSQIGHLYLGTKDYPKAWEYFEKGNQVMLKNKAEDQSDYGYTCNDFGQLYFMKGDYSLAIQWQQKALSLFQKDSTVDKQDIGAVLLYLGRAQSANGDYPEAIRSFQEDKRILTQLYGPDCHLLYYSNAEIANAFKKWHLKSDQDSLLENSRLYFRLAEKGIGQRIQNESFADTQKKVLYEAVPVFEKAIGTEILFSNKQNHPEALENAWRLSEVLHSYLLLSATQEANARHFAGIPDELLTKDSLIQAESITLKKTRQSLLQKGRTLTDSMVLAVNAQIYAKNEAIQAMRSEFEKQFPDYYKLKKDLQPVTLAEAQQLLSPQQTLLEYFTGDSSSFVFVLHQNDRTLVESPRNFPLSEWVKGLREGITGFHTSKIQTQDLYEKTVLQYADYAHKLYGKLLAPVAKYLTPELVIIPSEILAGVPFEALLSGTPKDLSNFKTYPFVLRKHTIHYVYSATMLHQMVNRKHRETNNGELLAFAPFFLADMNDLAFQMKEEDAARLGLTPLPFSGEEVLQAKQYYGVRSVVLMGNAASKQQFLATAGKFRVLHLATHGKANHGEGEFSFLAFSSEDGIVENGVLSAGELYNCSLNAELVVLSACETGIGEEQRGEGVVSLARAFAYAGTKSIVSSLWSVNDASTMYVMAQFYKALDAGKPKNNSLADAKRNYLEQYPGEAAHPFYWAGFVAVGDMSSLVP